MDNGFRKPDKCPHCEKKVDAATHLKDLKAAPRPGDLTVCIGCFKASRYDKNLKMEKFDVSTLDLQEARELHQLQVFLQQAKKRYDNGER